MVPAFSQLNRPEKQEEFDTLFSRAVRLNLLWIFPAVAVLFTIAKPFFTLWAGPEFGEKSTGPFYILLLGLIASIPAYVPFAAIAAKGRTDASAKLYWIELVLYAAALLVLIRYFGIAGAALSWSFRMLFDAAGLFTISRRIGVKGKLFDNVIFGSVALLTLLPIVLVRFLFDAPFILLLCVTAICLLIYGVIVWRSFIQREEQEWLIRTLATYIRRS
jgi:O-antigen/teichoic acid export membrane protein